MRPLENETGGVFHGLFLPLRKETLPAKKTLVLALIDELGAVQVGVAEEELLWVLNVIVGPVGAEVLVLLVGESALLEGEKGLLLDFDVGDFVVDEFESLIKAPFEPLHHEGDDQRNGTVLAVFAENQQGAVLALGLDEDFHEFGQELLESQLDEPLGADRGAEGVVLHALLFLVVVAQFFSLRGTIDEVGDFVGLVEVLVLFRVLQPRTYLP